MRMALTRGIDIRGSQVNICAYSISSGPEQFLRLFLFHSVKCRPYAAQTASHQQSHQSEVNPCQGRMSIDLCILFSMYELFREERETNDKQTEKVRMEFLRNLYVKNYDKLWSLALKMIRRAKRCLSYC